MKILYTHNSSKQGGMEQHVLDLVKGMIGVGNEVFVWCPVGKPADIYEGAGAKVFRKSIESDFDRSYIDDLTVFLKETQIEIIHAHELKAAANALVAARNAHTSVRITHVHTPISEWKISPTKRKVDTLFYSFIVNHFSDAEIALTESKKKIKIREGINKDKIVVIPNGLDITKLTVSQITKTDYEEETRKKYGINKNAFVFGNVGRISREKGHDVLLTAYKKFLSTDMYHSKDFVLFIAGGGELENEIRQLAVTKGVGDKVIFTGEFPAEDLVKIYSAFDFFVFPTLAEGFGLVLIEAMYMGLPVICSDLEVLKEVAGDTVTYFNTGDPSDLSEKMIEAYEKYVNNEEEPRMRGKQRVTELFTIDAFTNSYVSLYERLLNKK